MKQFLIFINVFLPWLREGHPETADSLLVERFSRKRVLFSHQTLGDMQLN